MAYEHAGTILGGLPVIAVLESGKDPDTPIGPGEYWTEVQALHWVKRDGSKGKEIPEKVYERAEAYDYAFCDLIENIHEQMAYEQWLVDQAALECCQCKGSGWDCPPWRLPMFPEGDTRPIAVVMQGIKRCRRCDHGIYVSRARAGLADACPY